METVLTSINKFLAHHAAKGIAPDLLARWSPEMETQVLVRPGTPVDGKRGCFSDVDFTWWNVRVPKNADSEPSFKDYAMTWPLDLYADAIGCTGWDWKNRRSRWVGFDFDNITAHAPGIGITNEQLQEVREKAAALPYVEVRRSTGGNGLHLYVHLNVETENHTVHAGLARSVLAMMSDHANFDFTSRMDCCGGNMWIWRKDVEAGSTGLQLIKPATASVVPPANWRDHIEAVAKRGKVSVGTEVDSLAQARKSIALEPTHLELIEALEQTVYATRWVNDLHLLQTHTRALAEVHESQTPPVRGVFATSSRGNNPDSPNCFMFPVEDGGWRVYRFSRGVSESATWQQDGKGWTTCDFNMAPTLRAACLAFGGVEDDRNGSFSFTDQAPAIKALAELGKQHSFPDGFKDRTVSLGTSKDGRLTICIKKEKGDKAPTGYLDTRAGWRQVTALRLEEPESANELVFDSVVRQLVSVDGRSAGWMICGDNGKWREASKDDCKSVLVSYEVSKQELDSILGRSIREPWKLVTRPFEAEFPGDRQWNRGAPQLAYEPATVDDLSHPHWDMILAHAGGELDEALARLDWAKAGGILKGADYLKAWIASMIRKPFEPLPYLFFFGPENSGKSIFHESIKELVTAGVVDANRSLKKDCDFNGELENAVLCYIEERDLSKRDGAREKVKEWVTARNLSVRRMRVDQYAVANTTHWVHCANEARYCPVFPGDTRITMIYVPAIADGVEIPKSILLAELKKEAPQFLRTLFDLELPAPRGRLGIPVVENDDKDDACKAVQSLWLQFRDERIERKEGETLFLSKIQEAFDEWCASRSLKPHGLTVRNLEVKPNPIAWKRHSDHGKMALDVCLALGA